MTMREHPRGRLTCRCADLPMSVVNCYLIFGEDITDKTVCVRQPPACDASLCSAHTVRESVYQVFASLLVSTVLLGFKLSAAKRLVQVNQRRIELKAALVRLEPRVEADKLDAWLADVAHDKKHREDRIAAMDSAAGREYNISEAELLKKGANMFAAFDASSAGAKQLKHSASVLYSETKLDAATGLLFGRAAAIVRATPQEIVAHMLSFDSHFNQSTADRTVWVRSEVVEHVNAYHMIAFNRLKLGAVSRRGRF